MFQTNSRPHTRRTYNRRNHALGDTVQPKMNNIVDISENYICQNYPAVLDLLLQDQTTQSPIFWATESYATMGEGYQYSDPITREKIIGVHGLVIRPRAVKSKEEQMGRTKEMAEVFTPSWVCNVQNNLIDEAWFGQKNLFNNESPNKKRWLATTDPIPFTNGKNWKDYVRTTRMEVACGEAPYLASRYDTTTGDFIPLRERIGMLDRKLRVVRENCHTPKDWLEMAEEAYKNIYAYEWQGDNLLLAREALLFSFVEYYEALFGEKPPADSIHHIAYIISWNVWQMDGLRGVTPQRCHKSVVKELFDKDNIRWHNSTHCLIRDWGERDSQTGEEGRIIKFVDL